MRGTREIKRRIRSVKSTQKITRAMEMVAAAKLRRAQERAESARPYAASIKESIARVIMDNDDLQSPLMEAKDSTKKCYVVFTSDRGLCGSFNTNVLKKAVLEIEQLPREQVAIVAIGRKARDFFRRREYNIIREYLDIEDRPGVSHAKELVSYLLQLFLNGEVGEIKIIYSEFVNVMVNRPRCLDLLPLEKESLLAPLAEEQKAADNKGKGQDEEEAERIYKFEPEPEVVLEALLSRLLSSLVFSALLEAKASEFGSRMSAMRTATENAKEMITKLNLEYNKARQSAITQEILEIVNTSEALSG